MCYQLSSILPFIQHVLAYSLLYTVYTVAATLLLLIGLYLNNNATICCFYSKCNDDYSGAFLLEYLVGSPSTNANGHIITFECNKGIPYQQLCPIPPTRNLINLNIKKSKVDT